MKNQTKAVIFTVLFTCIIFLGSVSLTALINYLNPTADQFITLLAIVALIFLLKLVYDMRLSQLEYEDQIQKMVDKFPK